MTELELLREEVRFKDEKIAFLEMQLAELRGKVFAGKLGKIDNSDINWAQQELSITDSP